MPEICPWKSNRCFPMNQKENIYSKMLRQQRKRYIQKKRSGYKWRICIWVYRSAKNEEGIYPRVYIPVYYYLRLNWEYLSKNGSNVNDRSHFVNDRSHFVNDRSGAHINFVPKPPIYNTSWTGIVIAYIMFGFEKGDDIRSKFSSYSKQTIH